MDKMYFRNFLARAYAAHGKNAPAAGLVIEVIWEKVCDLPDEFMPWASEKISNLEKFPQNVGAYLRGNLWPEWRRLNPSKVVRDNRTCPDCSGKHDLPGGGFYYWAADDEGVFWQYFAPCKCAGDKIPPITKQQVLYQGFCIVPGDYSGSLLEFEHEMRHGQPLVRGRVSERIRLACARRRQGDRQSDRRFQNLSERERADCFAEV